MPNLLGQLAEAWVDNVTNLFGDQPDVAFRSGVASGPRRLTSRQQRLGEYGQLRARYDPFKSTRRSLYSRTDWRGESPFLGLSNSGWGGWGEAAARRPRDSGWGGAPPAGLFG